jgi:CBS domain-containing protein
MHAHVKDVMTTSVLTVTVGTPYRDMAAMLRAHEVSGFPVVDDRGKVIGVVSEGDLLASQALDPGPPGHPGPPYRPPFRKRETTAGDLMTSPAVTVGPDEQVKYAAYLMHSRKLGRLPVVDREGRLVGILSRADVLRVFSRPDKEILREITQDVIAEGFFTDPARLTVTVQDGVVTLAGDPGSAILGYNIVDQVRKVEGVVTVRDKFSYPPRT